MDLQIGKLYWKKERGALQAGRPKLVLVLSVIGNSDFEGYGGVVRLLNIETQVKYNMQLYWLGLTFTLSPA